MPRGEAPTPSGGNPDGSDLRNAASQIEGLLTEGEDGSLNVGDGRISRAHPDYDGPKGYDEQEPKRDTKGRFTKKSAPPDGDAEEQLGDDADPDVEDQLAEGDDADEDVDTDDTDEQLADSADEKPDSEDSETGEAIETVAQMAEALDMTVDEFLDSITDTFGAAGEETTVTLKELRAGYQKDADYRRNTQKLAEKTRAAEQDYQQRMQQFDESHRFLAAHLNATEDLISKQLEDPSLAALRQSDPAEWSARNAELAQQLGTIRNAREQAMQQYAGFHQQQLTDLKTRELQALQEALPDFKSDVHGEAARKIMASVGYTPQEISQIFDHRLVLAALELGRLREEVETLRAKEAKAKDTVKRVTKEVPKLQKPGKRVPVRNITRDNLAKLRARAKKSGSLEDAASVIENMGIL